MGGTENVDPPEHTQVWFGPESRPLYGWVSRPAGGVARGGAILCPPMGEEGRAAHRTFRRLAEALENSGITAQIAAARLFPGRPNRVPADGETGQGGAT